MTYRARNALLFVAVIFALNTLIADADRGRRRLCGIQLVRHAFDVCQSPCMPSDSGTRQYRGGFVYKCCSAAGCTDDFIRNFCCAAPDNKVGHHKFVLNGPYKPRNPIPSEEPPSFHQILFNNHVGNEAASTMA